MQLTSSADRRSTETKGQSFISRRQVYSSFNLALPPISTLHSHDSKVGLTAFLDQKSPWDVSVRTLADLSTATPLHHWDLGIVMRLNLKPCNDCYGGPSTKRTNLVRLLYIVAWRNHYCPELYLSRLDYLANNQC